MYWNNACSNNESWLLFVIIVRFQGWSQSSPTHEKTTQKSLCWETNRKCKKKFECQRNETERIKFEKLVRKATPIFPIVFL